MKSYCDKVFDYFLVRFMYTYRTSSNITRHENKQRRALLSIAIGQKRTKSKGIMRTKTRAISPFSLQHAELSDDEPVWMSKVSLFNTKIINTG